MKTQRMKTVSSKKYQSGLTLLELIVTLGIVGVVSTLGMSSMSSLLDASDSDNYIRELTKTVNFSRVQSVSTGQTVTLCTIVDNICANDWTKDITVFIDSGSNRTLGANAVLRILEAVPAQDTLSYTGTALGISFYPDGSIGDTDNGTFTYKANNACNVNSRGTDVNGTGRARYIDTVTC